MIEKIVNKKNDIYESIAMYSDRIYYSVLAFLIVIRYITTNKICVVFTYSPFDHLWMINRAKCIAYGQWLGPYSKYTLVKGCVFPIFLAFCHNMGFNYIHAIITLNIIAIVFFMYSIHTLIPNRVVKTIIFVILLFNPAYISAHGLQFTYSTAIITAEVLFAFGSILSMYIYRNNRKKHILYSILSGIMLALMWQTKDDAIWIIPFILGVVIIIIAEGIIRKEEFARKIVVSLLPFLIIVFFNVTIALVNYCDYGTFVTRELNQGACADLVSQMFAIDAGEEKPRLSVSEEKFSIIAKESPSLAMVEDRYYEAASYWSYFGDYPDTKNVCDGWFFFALRDALEDAGLFLNSKTMNEFCLKVSEEIDAAVNEGRLCYKNGFSSVRFSPWKEGYSTKMLDNMKRSYLYTLSFSGCQQTFYSTFSDPEAVKNERFLFATAHFDKYSYDDLFLYTGLNRVAVSYGYITPFIFSLIFVLWVYDVIMCVIKKKSYNDSQITMLLLQFGILVSSFVIVLGVSYTDLTSFPCIDGGRLIAVYVLNLMMIGIGVGRLFSKTDRETESEDQ